ncbi:MAG TPA: VOC family protein [Pyrinomonadaceae bacterium]|nr:VOC family protein [Pyrinomonadaceae bacterium]
MKLFICLATVLLLTNSGGSRQIPRAEAESLIRTYAVMVNVDDMQKARSFYCNKLGFQPEMDRYNPNYAILKSADGESLILKRVSKLRMANRTDTQLSFTLQVNDLNRSIKRMEALGVELAEPQPRKEAVGNAIFIKDPFGRLISLMHQTIVKTESFREPKIYNYGFLVPDMQIARDFYSNKLGFVVRSEKYLPLDLPLGHKDKSFAFMLHYRPGVMPVKDDHDSAFNTLILQTTDLSAVTEELKRKGVKILNAGPTTERTTALLIEDPFGNVFLIQEIKSQNVP